MAAWQDAYTGAGVTIGIVDSGIDSTNPEFAGRISPLSADFAGNGTYEGVGEHGTWVALVAAAARDGSGTVGIAYDATILALRTDEPGTCAVDCEFFDYAIGAAIDHAVVNGARVINISLGGGAPTSDVTDAIARAAAAGVVVVVSAGNDGTRNPDTFATGMLAFASGNLIIAGSVDSSGVLSSFSNRAGNTSAQDSYLTALGEDILIQDGGSFFISGTSFSAPQIAGAAALLAQAFPSLTGAEIVDLLLNSAFDAGSAGTDSTYGRGILDIAKAFAPAGTTSLAGSHTALALTDGTGTTSVAMGDALSGASLGAVILDGYDRAYVRDLAAAMTGASLTPRLTQALAGEQRFLAAANDKLSLGFTIDARAEREGATWPVAMRLSQDDADEAKVLAAKAALRISPKAQVGFAFAGSAAGLVAQMQGASQPAFFIATEAGEEDGFQADGRLSMALRRQAGPWGLTLSGEAAQVLSGAPQMRGDILRASRSRDGMTRFGVTVDRDWGGLSTTLGVNWLAEDRTVLGARFHDGFGGKGADSLFLDASLGWQFAPAWRVGASWREGWTSARAAGFIAGGSLMRSRAWSLDLSRDRFFGKHDRLAFRLAQPLRVEQGGLTFDLPVSWDYASETPGFSRQQFNLAPKGREIMGELAWSGPLLSGWASAGVFYRKDPGHYASVPDDKGVALRWRTEF